MHLFSSFAVNLTVDEIKQEEDSLDGMDKTVTEAAPAEPPKETSPDDEPLLKRRSATRAAAAASPAASPAAKQKAPGGPKGKGKAVAGEGAKKGKASKATSGASGSPGGAASGAASGAAKKKGQAEDAVGKSDTPKKAPTNTPMGVVITSPQEKFTARKSVPGGSNPKVSFG